MNANLNPALQNRDITLVLDKSGSMTNTDTPNGKTRWDASRETTESLAREAAQYDPDGITVITFAGNYKEYVNTTPQTVENIFKEQRPGGSTVLAPVLKHCFEGYLKRKANGSVKPNGELLLVITDGQPEDERQVAQEIINFTKKLENGDSEYGISFIQVGRDTGARDFLKRLDDDLQKLGAKFDIVDTVTMDDIENGKSLEEILMGALND